MAPLDHQTQVLKGDDALAFLRDRIDQHSEALHAALAPFAAGQAVDVWLKTLRAVEEFINLVLFGLDDEAIGAALIMLPINAFETQPRRFKAVRHHITYRYGEAFSTRFTTLLMQAAAIGRAFTLHGISSALRESSTIGTAVGYFQSRRRHLVATLYTLPRVCRSHQLMHPLDTLNQILPLIELNGIALTGLYQQVMLAEAFDDYALLVDEGGFIGSREYPALDPSFAEPERASIIEITAGIDDPRPANLEAVRHDRLFSAAELRNDIRLLETAYAEFDLAGSAFGPAAALVRQLSEIAIGDHWVRISLADFHRLADELGVSQPLRQAFLHTEDSYVANTNGYAPFIEIEGQLHSSVTLLSRFLYAWKNVCLYRNRRFQIRSGFIFERTVAAELERQGFRLTGIKRLKRKEFDVVTVRDGVIFNVQCKNNLIDPSRLEGNPKLFARFNRARVASYERALRKEVGREALLITQLGLTRIAHLVVTRFPVATDNQKIISFSRIEAFSSVATRLAAEMR